MLNVERRGTKVSLYRAIIIGTAALALIAVSFYGELDKFAQGEVIDTRNESIGIYVVSRAINALVSVLQTAEIKVPLLASAEVGQMLDPVNDAVERLSSILVWAVGSLLVQQILLEIAASPLFKWILCSIGVAMAALLLLMEWNRFRVGSRQNPCRFRQHAETVKGLARATVCRGHHRPIHRARVYRPEFPGQPDVS